MLQLKAPENPFGECASDFERLFARFGQYRDAVRDKVQEALTQRYELLRREAAQASITMYQGAVLSALTDVLATNMPDLQAQAWEAVRAANASMVSLAIRLDKRTERLKKMKD